MTLNYLCLGLVLLMLFMAAVLYIRSAVLKAAQTPRGELQRALKRNGISAAILGTRDASLLWTDAAGFVDGEASAAAVSHAEHGIIGRINKLFD